MNSVIVICGPTASGKTSLAIEAAKVFNAEVVSADSMQIYKEMQIGTAKPDMQERDGIVHHMMDVVSVCEEYNVSRYVSDASACIDDIFARKKNVIIAGGTGLYIDTLINNVNLFDFDNDPDYRAFLNDIALSKGGSALAEMLRKIDPESADRIHENDIKRLVRALEVFKATGKTQTQLHIESKRSRKYQPVFIALNFSDRQALYDRINLRVDIMMQNGLVDEARSLMTMPLSSTARAAIGYKDIFDYLNGEITFETAVENIKQKSRNYAKRQLTWFRKNDEITWFEPDTYIKPSDMYDEVCSYILKQMR